MWAGDVGPEGGSWDGVGSTFVGQLYLQSIRPFLCWVPFARALSLHSCGVEAILLPSCLSHPPSPSSLSHCWVFPLLCLLRPAMTTPASFLHVPGNFHALKLLSGPLVKRPLMEVAVGWFFFSILEASFLSERVKTQHSRAKAWTR